MPPVSDLRVHLPSTLPLLVLPRSTLPARLQFLPTRFCSHVPSPAGRLCPETPGSHPNASVRGLRYGTAGPRLFLKMDLERISLLSTPPSQSTRAPVLSPRQTDLRGNQPAQVPSLHPARTRLY